MVIQLARNINKWTWIIVVGSFWKCETWDLPSNLSRFWWGNIWLICEFPSVLEHHYVYIQMLDTYCIYLRFKPHVWSLKLALLLVLGLVFEPRLKPWESHPWNGDIWGYPSVLLVLKVGNGGCWDDSWYLWNGLFPHVAPVSCSFMCSFPWNHFGDSMTHRFTGLGWMWDL